MRVPSALPLGPTTVLARDLPVLKAQSARPVDLVVIILLPWVIFTLIVGLFAISYEDFSPLVWALVASSALLALLFISVGGGSGKAAQLALGLLVLTSVGVAVPVGLFVEYNYMAEFTRIDSGATYRRVSPAAPAAAYGDASVLEFERGAAVDLEQSVGFMRLGDVYCAAPIRGRSGLGAWSAAPQFWAVGRDCCNRRGGFTCGDVSDAAAHSGVVVDDGAGLFLTAVRVAGATFDLPPPSGQPLFVRWTADAAAYKDKLFSSAVTLSAVASALHFLGSTIAGLLLSRSLFR